MRVDVVDRLLGPGGVPGGGAVVVQLVTAHHLAGGAQQLEVGEVPGHAQADQVGAVPQVAQLLLLARFRVAVGHRVQAVAEALRGALVGVEGAAAVDGVAQAVVEGADRGAAQLPLRGLGEAGVAGDLAEVPALAVEVDALAVHPVGLEGERIERLAHGEHVLGAVVAHQVEAEAVHPVVAGPGHGGVHHDLLAHGVLGGDVRAAGGGLHRALEAQAVVVAGHHPVQHGGLRLAVRGGVVVHLVEHHLQAHLVQLAHHGAELARALAAHLMPVGRIGALGGHVVQRVVAPVVGILVGDRGHRRLLRLGRRARIGRDVRLDLERSVLLDGGDVEGGQQMHGGHARLGELSQACRAGRVGVAEGGVGAAQLLGQGLITGGEVPHVQLVDGLVGELVHRRGGGLGPDLGCPARIVEVQQHRVLRVQGQAHRVRVGDRVGDDLAEGGHEDLHRVGVRLVGPAGLAGRGPHPARAALHLDLGRGGGTGGRRVGDGLGRAVQLQGHGLRGRRPQPQRRHAVLPAHAELLGGGVLGVEVIEHAGDLQPGEGLDPVGPVLGDHDLAAQRLLEHLTVQRR